MNENGNDVYQMLLNMGVSVTIMNEDVVEETKNPPVRTRPEEARNASTRSHESHVIPVLPQPPARPIMQQPQQHTYFPGPQPPFSPQPPFLPPPIGSLDHMQMFGFPPTQFPPRPPGFLPFMHPHHPAPGLPLQQHHPQHLQQQNVAPFPYMAPFGPLNTGPLTQQARPMLVPHRQEKPRKNSIQSASSFDEDYTQIAEALDRTVLSPSEHEDVMVEKKRETTQLPSDPVVKSHNKKQNVQMPTGELKKKISNYPPLEFLRGSFSRQVNEIVSHVSPEPSDRNRLRKCMDFLQSKVQSVFSKAEVHAFGSTACDMYLKGSADMDVCVVMTEPLNKESEYYREWKIREEEIAQQFEKTESEREKEWSVKEDQRIKELKEAHEAAEEVTDEMREKLKRREFRKREPKPFDFAHFVLERVFQGLKGDSRVDDPQLIINTRIPIVKFNDLQTGLQVDIGFNNLLGIYNTRLISTYGLIDPRFKQLVLFIKYWAKRKTINDTYHGTLSSYAYVLMIIHFLQFGCSPAVLPCLQAFDRSKRSIIQVDGQKYDVSFEDDLQIINSKFPVGQNSQSIGELLHSFFDYWARIFDYKNSVASIRTGGLLTKEEKNWLPLIEQQKMNEGEDQAETAPVQTETETSDQQGKKIFQRYWICIEDPFEVDHNLGRPVGRDSLYFIRGEFLEGIHLLGNQRSYSRAYDLQLKQGTDNYRLAPKLAWSLCEETKYKTREEHKVRNMENMQRKKSKQKQEEEGTESNDTK